jgi:hypothetical protein
MNGELKEIVVATKADISKLPYKLEEGVYIVGTGNTGAAFALACLGGLYTGIMFLSAFTIKLPHADYKSPPVL